MTPMIRKPLHIWSCATAPFACAAKAACRSGNVMRCRNASLKQKRGRQTESASRSVYSTRHLNSGDLLRFPFLVTDLQLLLCCYLLNVRQPRSGKRFHIVRVPHGLTRILVALTSRLLLFVTVRRFRPRISRYNQIRIPIYPFLQVIVDMMRKQQVSRSGAATRIGDLFVLTRSRIVARRFLIRLLLCGVQSNVAVVIPQVG